MKRSFRKSALAVTVALLTTCLLAAPVSAAMRGSGASYWREDTDHEGPDRMLHLPNGTKMPTVKMTESESAWLLQWQSEMAGIQLGGIDADVFSVLNVAVGDSVEIHVTQNGFDELGPLGMNLGRPGNIAHASIGTKSGKNQRDMTIDDMYVTPYNSSNGGYRDVCLELMVNGLEEGVDYLYFRDYTGLPGMFMKIVVGPAGSESTSSGISTSKSTSGNSSSGNSGSSSSSGSGSSAGSSGSSSATNQNTKATTSASGSNYSVKVGDTLATIALNYYGDHQLWPYLQQANQENLNQTANGLIYEEFVMHLPDTLNGVSRIAPPTVGSGEVLYTVQAGDSYGSIALTHFGDMSRYEEIYNRNSDRLKDINTLIAGQIIVLP